MVDTRCPVCNAPVSIENEVATVRFTHLRAESGIVIVLDGQRAVHRCDQLSIDDEQQLLQALD